METCTFSSMGDGEKAGFKGFKGINMIEACIILRKMVLMGRLPDVHVICFCRTIYTLNYPMGDCGS